MQLATAGPRPSRGVLAPVLDEDLGGGRGALGGVAERADRFELVRTRHDGRPLPVRSRERVVRVRHRQTRVALVPQRRQRRCHPVRRRARAHCLVVQLHRVDGLAEALCAIQEQPLRTGWVAQRQREPRLSSDYVCPLGVDQVPRDRRPAALHGCRHALRVPRVIGHSGQQRVSALHRPERVVVLQVDQSLPQPPGGVHIPPSQHAKTTERARADASGRFVVGPDCLSQRPAHPPLDFVDFKAGRGAGDGGHHHRQLVGLITQRDGWPQPDDQLVGLTDAAAVEQLDGMDDLHLPPLRRLECLVGKRLSGQLARDAKVGVHRDGSQPDWRQLAPPSRIIPPPQGPGHQGQGLLRSTQAPHQSDRALLHISERLLLGLERSFKRRQDLLGVLVALAHGTRARDQQRGLASGATIEGQPAKPFAELRIPRCNCRRGGLHRQIRGDGVAGIEQPAGDPQRVVARAVGVRPHGAGELAARLGCSDQRHR